MLSRFSRHRWLVGGVVVASLTAGVLAAPSAQAIVNGSVDSGAHPNVGALTVVTPQGRVLACTGTLISPTVLLTAAHCTAQLQQLGYTQTDVSFDTDIGSGSTITCGLTDCYVSPDPSSLHTGTMYTNPAFKFSPGQSYSTSTDSHDIAVVVFDQAITGITPASLPTAGLLDQMAASRTLASTVFTNVGYGWNAVVDKSSAHWTGSFDGLRRYAIGGSQSLTTSDLKVTGNPALEYGGACSHDSGGPAFIGNSSIIAGELSRLQGDCSATYDSYRVDTASARSFLSNFTSVP
jgi:hypothetical protein